MARIRTIKPAFFRHADLYEAEVASGLPLRIAFAGIWTAADREGRFKWRPRELKLDCLPHDEVDFSRVLDALVTGGWIVRYAVDGLEYGAIPTWKDHQIINNREQASNLPAYNEINALTREARVDVATVTPLKSAQGEGKGREGERKGKDSRAASPSNGDFEEFKRDYPKRAGNYGWKAAERKYLALVKTGVSPQSINTAVRRHAEEMRKLKRLGSEFVPMPASWLNSEDFVFVAVDAFNDAPQPIDWDNVVSFYKRTRIWTRGVGPDPDSSACEAPPEVLRKHGIQPTGAL